MITGEIVKGQDLGPKFTTASEFMTSAIQAGVGQLATKLVRMTKKKLTGDVLNVRRGRLRRSIHAETEFTPEQAIAAVGTNVIYAKIHEYGGIIRPKTKKALKFQIGGSWVITKKVVMPKRSFLRSSMQELAPKIPGELVKAAAKGAEDFRRSLS